MNLSPKFQKVGKGLSAAVTVAMAAMLLTSCSGGASTPGAGAGDDSAIEVWARADAKASEAYNAIFDAFTEETGIKVNFQGVVEFDSQLQTRAASKDLPDILINDSANLGNYAAQGYLQTLDPKSVKGNEAISGALWDEAKGVDGNVYAVPFSRQTMVTLVRKDWREKLGMEIPKTHEELSKLAEAFATQDPDGNGKADTYGMTVPGSTERGYMAWWASSYIWQDGGDFLKSDGKGKFSSAVATSETKEGVAWIKEQFCTPGLVQPGALTAPTSVSNPFFQTGKTGIQLVGPYAFKAHDAELGKDKYEVIETPVGSAGATVLAEGENIYVTASNQKPEETSAVLDFLVSEKGQSLGMTGGSTPVVRVPVNASVDAAKTHGDERWAIVQKQLNESSQSFPASINFIPVKMLVAESLNKIMASCDADNISSELSVLDEAINKELSSQDAKS